ncbi:MAG: kelch repeat-containing protein, partial [Cystobacter sp.]
MAALWCVLVACGGPLSEGEGEDALLATTRPQGLSSGDKVLILSETVRGGVNSVEAKKARQLGYEVELADNARWKAMGSAAFASYRALILGDNSCSLQPELMRAATDSAHIWGPVVDGNVIIVGTDPVYHGKANDQVTLNAVKFAAAQSGKTGMYISLSCYYHETAPGTPVSVPVLNPFGSFVVTGVGCYNDAHIVASHEALNGLTDDVLSNWGCSVHEAFVSYPEANFTPLVIARDTPGQARWPGSRDFADGSHGVPYVLVRGAVPVRCGDGVVQHPEECDTGARNGVPGTQCSSVCRKHWCGDGVVDPGEQCDTGAANGSGTCSASCQSVASANRPPVALCTDLTLPVGPTCGASGSVNAGSYDPDGNLVGCTQSPMSFGLGTTRVLLTCTDSQGLSASCAATVSAVDTTPPVMACPADFTAECLGGGALGGYPPQAASDNCGISSVEGPATNFYPLGVTRRTYTVRDSSQNQTTCSFTATVSDTQPPQLFLYGASAVSLECGENFVEQGYLAYDDCSGGQRVTRSGTVNNRVPGTYVLTYSATDAAGLTQTATRTVTVVPGPGCEDVSQGGWIPTGSMALPRLSHSTTLLVDGRVLAAGGFNSTAELYDPVTKKWTATGSTQSAHRGHTATLLSDGRVLLAGGISSTSKPSAELYIPATGRWQATGRLTAQRFYHAAVLLPGGKVLVAGGFGTESRGPALTSAELYDPATGVWTPTGSLAQARGFHTMTLLGNGKVLVTGGSEQPDDDVDDEALLSGAELYDPATGTWTSAGAMSTGRAWHSATVLPGGRVLVVGGAGVDIALGASAELYDPATGAWSATGSLRSPRRWHTATLLPGGEVLVAGGYHPFLGIQYASERYNPATGQWSATARMNVDR